MKKEKDLLKKKEEDDRRVKEEFKTEVGQLKN